MLGQIRSFLAVVEEGSLHRAAARLRISQPALSRQMQALEQELGGRLLERTSTGVRPTNGGYALAARMPVLLEAFDSAVAEVRKAVRGESTVLRIGYLASAAPHYLTPALAALRKSQPETKVKLMDLTPGEQIAGLRRGELDLALTDGSGTLLEREFYARKIGESHCVAALPVGHALAGEKEVHIRQLKAEAFITGSADDLPGYERWITTLCRQAGKFRPHLVTRAGSLDDGLNLVANEDFAALLPAYVAGKSAPGVVFVPVADELARVDLYLAWQRGPTSPALRALVEAMGQLGQACNTAQTKAAQQREAARPKAGRKPAKGRR